MIKNYFKTAWRNLLRNKTTSFINIGGLATGMAVVLLIGLWIHNELSFDTYHQHYDRIAIAMQQQTQNGETATFNAVPLPLADELRTTYGDQFKQVVLSSFTWNHTLATSGNKQLSRAGNFMEPAAPEMFTLKMISGTRDALSDPSSVILSASTAKALFGNADPIDQRLRLDNKMNVKVTGVYEDLPVNTTLGQLGFIAPWTLYSAADENVKSNRTNWNNSVYQLYVQLAPKAEVNSVSAQIKDVKLRHVAAAAAKYKPLIFLQPMSRWHLYAEFKNGVNTGGAIRNVWLFGTIGLFVLLLACINFMNLSTARSEKRAKEVGVRKAVGSLRYQLILQFFVESAGMAFLALFLAVFLAWLALPWFNRIAGQEITILWLSPWFWLACITFSLVVGLLAGSYPALYLSSFEASKVLKGVFRAGRLAALPRKILVVAQFTVSILLIIGTVVIFRQVRFSQNRQVGYEREGLISIEMNSRQVHDHFQSFRNDLIGTGVVSEIAESGSPATAVYNDQGGFSWNGKDPGMADDFAIVGSSFHFGKTVSWTLESGRDFFRGSAFGFIGADPQRGRGGLYAS